MARRQRKLGWHYNAEEERFTTPGGQVVTLYDIAQRMQDDLNCKHDLRGPWEGWTIRGQFLKGPGGVRLNPETARMLVLWVKEASGREEIPDRSPRARVVPYPPFRLVG